MSISESDDANQSDRIAKRIPQALSSDAKVLKAEERPIHQGFFHTIDLPQTPDRERRLPATGWYEAPESLIHLGDDLGHDLTTFLRRIGPQSNWLLWRSGPATDGDARYAALLVSDVTQMVTFRLHPDGTGMGVGADGLTHSRFRSWKESLRDNPGGVSSS
jgi:hypothetical protein